MPGFRIQLDAAPSPSEVALREFLRFVDRCDDGYRQAGAFLIFRDQNGEPEFRIRLERNRKSVIALRLSSAGVFHYRFSRHDSSLWFANNASE
jgi:hypothetical protein